MKVTILLCDSAQAVNNKLYILGAGWSLIGPEPAPMAIAFKIDVPWDQTNRKHRWHLELVDADGHTVQIPDSPEGEGRIELDAEFEVGRPPGVDPGTPIDLATAINMGPLPLTPGRYSWLLSINGHHDENWDLSFSVRSGPALPSVQ